MCDSIPISRLRGLKVEYANDLYDLAQFILKVQLASDAPTLKSRGTVNGLIADYEYLLNINGHHVRDMVTKHGLPLNASIMPDEEHIEWEKMTENIRQGNNQPADRRQTPKEAPSGRRFKL